MKIYVRDAFQKEKRVIGESRDDLVGFLSKSRTITYMMMVLRWFDEYNGGPLLIKNGDTMDVWTVSE